MYPRCLAQCLGLGSRGSGLWNKMGRGRRCLQLTFNWPWNGMQGLRKNPGDYRRLSSPSVLLGQGQKEVCSGRSSSKSYLLCLLLKSPCIPKELFVYHLGQLYLSIPLLSPLLKGGPCCMKRFTFCYFYLIFLLFKKVMK